MIQDILKTLSDTELSVIVDELNDLNVDNLSIFEQLFSKKNDNDSYVFKPDFRENLISLVALELRDRLEEVNKYLRNLRNRFIEKHENV